MKLSYSVKDLQVNIPLPEEFTGADELLSVNIHIGELNYSLEDVTVTDLVSGLKEIISLFLDK
jgi:hypothetical protein